MFSFLADAVTALCVLIMLAAIVVNFLNTNQPREFKERRSPVATASMTAFFVLLYFTIRFRWSAFDCSGLLIFRSFGLALMLFSAAFNVWGRFYLKTNWADHVRIYDDQTLITSGLAFAVVDTTNIPVNFDLVEEIIATNSNGNYYQVLSNLNNSLSQFST